MGERVVLHGQVLEDLPSPAGALRAVRRGAWRAGGHPVWVSRWCPQARVQQHTVEQMIESFVPVPILDLDALVPQTVVQFVRVLQILDMSTPVEQVIDVPNIISQDFIPQLVERLVDMPVPYLECSFEEAMVLARYRDADGREWRHCAGPQADCWWMWDTGHTQWDLRRGSPPGRYTNTGQRGRPKDPGADRGRGGAGG